jgi:hypothetical protein
MFVVLLFDWIDMAAPNSAIPLCNARHGQPIEVDHQQCPSSPPHVAQGRIQPKNEEHDQPK